MLQTYAGSKKCTCCHTSDYDCGFYTKLLINRCDDVQQEALKAQPDSAGMQETIILSECNNLCYIEYSWRLLLD